MSNDNLALWNRVKTTDVSATKANNQGGRRSTSINGYSIIKTATKEWGPIGSGWWYEVVDERFDEGAPIINPEGVELCKTVTHTCVMDLFVDGNRPIRQYGHTPYIYMSKHGPITDPEGPKKSLMDALKKCLSMLGVSADVFLGEFDNFNYVEELKNEQALEKAENKQEEELKQEREYQQWLDSTLKTMANAASMNELQKLYEIAMAKIARKRDKEGQAKAIETKNKAKARLEGKS